VPWGGLAQPVDVEGRRPPEPALNDHPIAVSEQGVARRAKDVVPFPPSFDHLTGDWKRTDRRQILAGTAGIKQFVLAELASGDGPTDKGTGGPSVFEELAGREGSVLRLVVHVLAARREKRNSRSPRNAKDLSETSPAGDRRLNAQLRKPPSGEDP
jgi:hypothetical protein